MNKTRFPIFTATALALLPIGLSAQTAVTWDGLAGDGLYETDGNWGGTAPADDLTSNIATFTGGTVDLSTTRQVSGLDFNSGSTLSGTGSLELGLGGIEVNRNSIINTAGLVLNQSNTTVTLAGGRLSFGTSTTVSGTGALTATGGNTLYMDNTSSANTYAGGTTITGGATVSVKRGDALGTGTLTLDNGTFSRNGAGYNFANDVTVNAGGGTIIIDGDLTGAISGAGALTIIGGHSSGDKTISSDSSLHSGGMTLDNTLFRTSNNTAYGTGDITLKNGATIKNNSNHLIFANNFILDAESGGKFIAGWGRSITVNGVISGDGSLTILSDSGTINLNADNTYTGETIIQGKVSGNTGSFGDNTTAGSITIDGGTMVASNNLNLGSRAVTLNGDTHMQVYNSRGLTIDGVVDGTGSLTVDNDGGSVRLFNAANSYSGGTTVIGKVNARTGGFGTGTVTLDDQNGSRGWVQNESGAATHANDFIISNANNGGRMKAGWNSNLTITGVVSGAGGMVIEGDSGTVVWSNVANTYSGAITLESSYDEGSLVNAARMSVESLGAGATVTGDVDSIFTFTGDAVIDGASAFAGTTTIAGDASVGGDGSLAGALVFETGATFNFVAGETLTVAGDVSFGTGFGVDDIDGLSSATVAAVYTLIDGTSTDFALAGLDNWGSANAYDLGDDMIAYFQSGSLQLVVEAVPEPSSFALIAGALALGSVMTRRRRS